MDLTLREIPRFPPPWAFASSGRAEERRGRVLMRRAFVELKLVFMRAAADVPGPAGQQLQTRVRQAAEPIELWLLRAALLGALMFDDEERAADHREAMATALAQVFPGIEPRGQTLSRY
jgi:hypothetical protein